MIRIKWFGHSAFLIYGDKGNILIDPYLNQNPLSPVKAKDLNNIDIILVTHGHFDHLGDTIEIASNNKSKVIAIAELSSYLSKFDIDTIGMNFGGKVEINGIKIWMFPAVHSSSIIDENGNIIYLGNPASFVIEYDGKKIYHAGDTMVFKDMELISKIVDGIDLALLPIGGRYIMDVDQALIAIDLLKPKYVIPMHYNTWNIIKADPYYLKEKAEEKGVKVFILKPGEEIEI